MWQFGQLDHEGEFGWHHLALEDVEELEQEVVAFQNDPIHELRRKGWLKFIRIEDMTAAAQKRLRTVNRQENGLWQLHLARYKWRIWGYFEDPRFSFLWWDRDHAVASGRSRQRNT